MATVHVHASQAPGKLGDSCLGVTRRRKLKMPACGAVPQEKMESSCRPGRGVPDLDLPRAEILLLNVYILVSSEISACIVGPQTKLLTFLWVLPCVGSHQKQDMQISEAVGSLWAGV